MFRQNLYNIDAVAGLTTAAAIKRTPSQMQNGVRNTNIWLRVTATCAIDNTADATAVLNRGSVLALLDEIVLDENGTDRMVIDGRALRFYSEMLAPSALSATRVTVVTKNKSYALEEMVCVNFAHPLSLDPLETSFVEHDVRQRLNVSFRPAANFVARLFTVGSAVVTVTNLNIEVLQEYDLAPASGIKQPYFIPRIVQQVENVTNTNAAQRAYIKTTNMIRAFVVAQRGTTLGEVGDILNGFVLRGDTRPIISAQSNIAAYLLRQEFTMGGAVVTANRSYFGINFQRYGQLSECLNPGQDTNLRFEFSVQTSAADTSGSQLVITSFELVRDPALCAPLDKIPFRF